MKSITWQKNDLFFFLLLINETITVFAQQPVLIFPKQSDPNFDPTLNIKLLQLIQLYGQKNFFQTLLFEEKKAVLEGCLFYCYCFY